MHNIGLRESPWENAMSSKTKIVVLHLKEVIYTGIFAVLTILFLVILFIMFAPKKESGEVAAPQTESERFVPGVYTTTLEIGDNSLDIEVTVDSNRIDSVRMVNLSEAVTTMYPLIEPSFDHLVNQILECQSLEGVTYPDESHYTCLVLLDAILGCLEKAEAQ